VFSSPSGAGKTTIINRIRHRYPNLAYSISATTRAPRPGEEDGRDYFFYSRKKFEAGIAENQFIEWAQVHDNYYGTPRFQIDESISRGIPILLDIDVQGKIQLDRLYPENTSIFIEPPNFTELERRLRQRSTEDEESLKVRLENARLETETARHRGRYTYYIVNDVLDEAVEKVLNILDMKGVLAHGRPETDR
jgi:guanylate kinase